MWVPDDAILNEVIAFCSALVQTPGLSGQERDVATLVAEKMHALGYDRVWVDRYGSVVGQREGSSPGPHLLFDAHTDTVEVTQPEKWSHDPFGGEIAGGRLWGRGATDMKGPLAAMLVTLAHLPRERLRGTLTVSCTVGEERTEGVALAEVLRRAPADVVIIGEPSELNLGIGQKGRVGYWVRTAGRPAHTSTPHLGANAVYAMLPVIARLRALPLPQDTLLGNGVQELVEIVSEPFPGKSIVPDGCRVRIDRRLVRGETRASLLHELQEALSDLAGVTYGISESPLPCYTGEMIPADDFHPAWAIEPDGDLAKRAGAALRSVGLPAAPWIAPYCTNGAYSAGEQDIPTLIFGPGSIRVAHAMDEYIAIEDLKQGAIGFAALAQGL